MFVYFGFVRNDRKQQVVILNLESNEQSRSKLSDGLQLTIARSLIHLLVNLSAAVTQNLSRLWSFQYKRESENLVAPRPTFKLEPQKFDQCRRRKVASRQQKRFSAISYGSTETVQVSVSRSEKLPSTLNHLDGIEVFESAQSLCLRMLIEALGWDGFMEQLPMSN